MPEPPGAGLRVRLRQQAPIPLDVELDCSAGEVLALVGPSGSGKSTILRCIAGLHRPRAGYVHCNGEIWLDAERGVEVATRRRSVGLVFQHFALFPHMSALQNVMAAQLHRPSREREKLAREWLERVHLGGLEARRPAALSGGQQQRVAVARALARDPKVLLLDEPFSSVDQVTRRKLHRELAALRRELKMPVILVTHDLDEAAMLADRMSILHRGATLQCGPPFEVMARPRNALVARLVDLKNVFEGLVVEHRPQAGPTLLQWGDRILEASSNPAFSPGERVCWAIPPANVILHRRDRPSRGERENPVAGVIAEFITLGETAHVEVRTEPRGDYALFMSLPAHVARRNRLGTGEPVKVSLLSSGIHLMPWEEPPEPEDRAS